MSSDREIGAPFTLVSLPPPLKSTQGRTQAANVSSLSGSKKRKRTEVAVAIDGDGISIYSLQNPQRITSYALPPHTSFTAPPCSIYRKGTASRPTRRITYASTSYANSGEKPQIVCFAEEFQKESSADTVKTAHVLNGQNGNIVSIDTIPVHDASLAKDASHDVLVTFEGGNTICLSANLGTIRWEAQLESPSNKSLTEGKRSTKVDHVTLASARNVVRGLLRSREDIAALLNPSLDTDSELLDITQVLCVVFRNADLTGSLGLYQLQSRSPDIVASRLPPLRRLLTLNLPSVSSAPTTAKRSYSLHAAAGVLHELVDGNLISYDFTRTLPKVYSELNAPGARLDSFLRISPDLVFGTSAQATGILDVKFNSVQAYNPLRADPNRSSPSKKRTYTDSNTPSMSEDVPTLIAYFSENGLAVGISNNEIIGYQLKNASWRKKQRSSGTLLINSIGRGISQYSRGVKQMPQPLDHSQRQAWLETATKLDKYVSKGNIASFEELFAQELGIELVAEEELQHAKAPLSPSMLNGTMTNGVHEHLPNAEGSNADESPEAEIPLRKWNLSDDVIDIAQHPHRHQALYALSKIFHFVERQPLSNQADRVPLEVDFFPPNVFQWLLRTGHLTKESIRRALQQSPATDLSIPASITDGDIVKAIVHFDPDFHILSAILIYGRFLPVGEVVQSIKSLVQSLDERPSVEPQPKLLTNGTAVSEDEMDVDITSELEAATNDLDRALSMLDHGVGTRSSTLRPALIRLHTFPPAVVTSTLRSMLPRQDLETLIHLLHIELKNGGWTSPYDFEDLDSSSAEPFSDGPDDHAVAVIASLLSCTLDAIGTGAFLAGVGASASGDPAEELMNDLHEETTLALNGFWEARFMRGLLSEFLRYSTNLSKTKKPDSKVLQEQGKPFAENLMPEDELPMLPLGGKVDLGVEKTKRGKGGRREERSAREIGMLISKRVPKYSFEKIVI